MPAIRTATAIALAACALAATPAAAQYGRLIPPQQMLALFDVACTRTSPDFARAIPPIAKAKKWDELGRTPTARPGDRGWLISVGGLPAIVDISRPDARTQNCSTSAVSDPALIVGAVQRIVGRPPTGTRKNAGRTEVVWTPGGKLPYRLVVTSTPGQAMTRLTLTSVSKR